MAFIKATGHCFTLDDVIYNLPEDISSELFNILYRIQDNLLFGNEF